MERESKKRRGCAATYRVRDAAAPDPAIIAGLVGAWYVAAVACGCLITNELSPRDAAAAAETLRYSLALTFPAFRPGPKGAALLEEPTGSGMKVVIWIVRSPLDHSVEDGENVSVGVAMFGLEQSVSGSVIVLVVAVYVVVPPRGPLGSHPIMESNEPSTDGWACVCIDRRVTVRFKSFFLLITGGYPKAPSGSVVLRASPLRVGIYEGRCAQAVHIPIA
jgi:hypothetical protein